MLTPILKHCFHSTFIYYLFSFNKEAQKQALDKTLENILVLLTEADKELLSTYVDDIDTWIETRIEAYMHQKSIQNKKDTE